VLDDLVPGTELALTTAFLVTMGSAPEEVVDHRGRCHIAIVRSEAIEYSLVGTRTRCSNAWPRRE
jgi:hypothetical protein